jgi:hypothetical protein
MFMKKGGITGGDMDIQYPHPFVVNDITMSGFQADLDHFRGIYVFLGKAVSAGKDHRCDKEGKAAHLHFFIKLGEITHSIALAFCLYCHYL